jgi:molybdenum ABC transporter molybdate-binding protein
MKQFPCCPGLTRSVALILLGTAALVVGAGVFLLLGGWSHLRPRLAAGNNPETPVEPLIVYCAAGLKGPVEQVARQYEQEHGVPIQLQYGGSQTLLANIEISQRGDLYLPADDYYIKLARDRKLIDEVIPLAEMTPVIAVARGNPRQIRTIDDLIRGEFPISLANPDATAVGKLTRDALKAVSRWDALTARSNQVAKFTVNDIANDIVSGAADAGIVWDAIVKQYPGLEAVPVPELNESKAKVAVSVLKSTQQPTAALRFARYLTARDRGLVEVAQSGFTAVAGDPWDDVPEVRLFAGAMLKPAIEPTIIAFEKREGVRVTRAYNGCGILVGQMRTGSVPDAYFACDQSFMKQVNDLFIDPIDVSSNQLVIVVHKGNPKEIRTIADLAKPDLRVGVGHELQCALGVITQETLSRAGVQKAIEKNIAARSPSGDLLVNQLRSGGLDAVIAYISNTADANDVEAYTITEYSCAIATQPMAVAKDVRHRQLTQRLMDALRSEQSRQRFEAYGFGWKLR